MASSNRSSSRVERRESVRDSRRPSFGEGDEYECDLGTLAISDGFRPMASAGQSRMSSPPSRPERRSLSPRRPSSTIKIRGLDPFALRHDGTMGSRIGSALAFNRGSITRPSSTSTEIPVIRPEGPYDGPAGPSHPYQMYPQNTQLARTASVVTSSTLQPSEGLYRGPLGPTHPYGMYSQNSISETVDSQVAGIPVGFPDRSDQYQRRLGPDGEEAGDMIGPLGHTEQLPPYTKYPDESFSRNVGPMIPAGAGGIGLATRNPEFASREDLNSTESRHSIHSFESENPLTTPPSSEKPADKKWKIIAKKKVWGIVPIWVLSLIGIVVVGFCIMIAGIVMKHKHDNSNSHSTPTSTPVTYSATMESFDAIPLASVPTGLPRIPVGNFSLSLSTPFINYQNCLDSPSSYAAWSCAMTLSEVTVSPADPSFDQLHQVEISINPANSSQSTFCYGSQTPSFVTNQIMTLGEDLSQTSFGDAWYFERPYDKLVIVPEKDLTPPPPNKRDVLHDIRAPFMQKGDVDIGDKPWFCYWNGTILEVFIYVHEPSPSSGGPPPQPPPGGPPPSQGSPKYPNQIKVEERRNTTLPQSLAPYCVQMEIHAGGTVVPVINSSGLPVTIQLKETVAANQRMLLKRSPVDDHNWGDHDFVERDIAGNCQCAWLSN